MSLERVEDIACFGGFQRRYKHQSKTTGTEMVFSVYLPPGAENGGVPVLYWLSGLTCTDKNFVEKAGAQRYAAEHGIAIVAPDTSPRGLDLPGEHADWDFGSGAGFYVDATNAPWNTNYRMFSYVTQELPDLVESSLKLLPKRGISGHSMGGHGALVAALRLPERYASVSAFAPICNPVNVPWGQKAFSNYLGDDKKAWEAWDAACLLKASGSRLTLLVDQGTKDQFLEAQLHPNALEEAGKSRGARVNVRMREGYDHSYYFISSFIGEHVAHHAKALLG